MMIPERPIIELFATSSVILSAEAFPHFAGTFVAILVLCSPGEATMTRGEVRWIRRWVDAGSRGFASLWFPR